MDIFQILEEAGQEVPNDLPRMADKWEAFKEREAEAKKAFGGRSGGGDIVISRIINLFFRKYIFLFHDFFFKVELAEVEVEVIFNFTIFFAIF